MGLIAVGLLVLTLGAFGSTGCLEAIAAAIPQATYLGVDIQGNVIDLNLLSGQVVVVYFDIWLPSWVKRSELAELCIDPAQNYRRKFVAFLQALHDTFHEITVIGVWFRETKESLSELVTELRITFPAIPDPDGEIADRFAVSTWPTLLLFDRAGKLRSIGTPGYFDIWDLFFYLMWQIRLSDLLQPMVTGEGSCENRGQDIVGDPSPSQL